MSTKTIWAVGALACLAWGGAAAAELRAVLEVNGQSAPVNCTLLGRRGDVVLARPSGAQAGTVSFRINALRAVRFALPANREPYAAAVREGQWRKAAAWMKPWIAPLLPYLDLPDNNALAVAIQYADALRSGGEFADALSVYERIRACATPALADRMALWSAYCELERKNWDEADARWQAVKPPPHHSDAFLLYHLIGGRLLLRQHRPTDALDHLAQGAALGELENDLYPENLFTLAGVYREVAREMQQRQTNPAPAEVAYGRSDVEAIWGAGLEVTNFFTVTRRLYDQLTNLYPASPWARAAAIQLNTLTNHETAADRNLSNE